MKQDALEIGPVKSILLIKLSSMGDIIHSLPVARALREGFPEARTTWIIDAGYEDLVDGNPDVDEVVMFRRSRWGKAGYPINKFSEVIEFARTLRRRRFDLAVDLQGLFRSGLIAYLSGTRWRVGLENAREMSGIFYNQKVPVPRRKLHAVDRYMLVARFLGIPSDVRDFSITPSPEDRRRVEQLLAGHNIGRQDALIVLAPAGRWSTKRWQWEKFAQVADFFNQKAHTHTVLIGGRSDAPLLERISAHTRSSPAVAAGSLRLRQVANLLERADLFITNDSGPMHLASAVGTPTLAIFGPTDPRLTGPYGNTHRIVQSSLPCVPCLSRQCSIGLECMHAISVGQVIEAGIELLANAKSRTP